MAFESDERIALEYTVGGSAVDGIEEIYVPDAEMWLAAPRTIVGMKPSGGSGTFSLTPNALTILRDDRPRLAMILAGAIARYAKSRCRAEVAAAGILPGRPGRPDAEHDRIGRRADDQRAHHPGPLG